MTSEAPHRPGQEPGEVSPGAGGPVPYGDRPAQQDNGYGAPDLGWAPPPPAGRPAQPAPAWAAADDQPPAWTPPGGQPAGRASAQVPPPAEPGGWGAAAQPAWATPEQSAPAWGAPDQGAPAWGTPEQAVPHRAAEPGPPAWAAAPQGNPTESTPPAWANEQGGPAWGTAPAPAGEQPAWAQAGDQGARGAAQVPAPATVPNESWATPAGQDDPNRSGGWSPATGQQDDDQGRAGGWRPAHEDNSGGWAVGAAAQQQDDQPAWGQQGEQPAPGWSPADPPARAAAKVSVPGAVRPENAWPGQQDQGHSGGWQNGPQAQDDDAARAGGWQNGPATQDDEAGRAGGWPAQQDEPPRPGGWENGRDDDPDRSGGWAAGRSAGAAEAPQPTAWGAPEEQRPAAAWSGAAAVPQQREPERPADEQGQPGWGSATGHAPAEASARASASVPSPDSPPAWAGNQDNPGQWAHERPAIPEAEPWSPDEAWGRAAEAQPEQAASPGWEPARADDGPIYQPAPGPGISPANAVPLPPQEQRVPGAALAAAPPADYAFNPGTESDDRNPRAYEPEQAADAGWGTPGPAHEEPQSPAGPMVPGPRTSPEAGAGGAVSASASVPMASRVTPPADQPLPTAGGPAPQPRVYGRPARPEPEEAPGQDGPNGFPEPGPQSRTDESDRQHGYADAPPVHSAPPSSPAAPPPFPPGVPSFVDPPGNNRPVNGVHPHNGERPGGPHDPFGSPGGQRDPFGAPAGHQDPFGPNGRQDPFGGPGGAPGDPSGGPVGGRASVGVPGPMGEPGGFPPAFPPPPQQAPPAWSQAGPGGDPDQGRFEAFRPEAEQKTEAPTPKVRNGRVLAAVLIAAVLILAVPLGLLTLLGKIGGDDKPAGFDPAVGSCVKQSGTTAVAATCGEQGAFTVVSRVDSKDKCADPTQPQVMLPGDGANRVLCLKPAGQ